MKNSKGTAWRVDDQGRLLTPDGAFVAMFKNGVIFFYDRKRGTYTAFTLADLWALIADELDVPDAPPEIKRRVAGSWDS